MFISDQFTVLGQFHKEIRPRQKHRPKKQKRLLLRPNWFQVYWLRLLQNHPKMKLPAFSARIVRHERGAKETLDKKSQVKPSEPCPQRALRVRIKVVPGGAPNDEPASGGG